MDSLPARGARVRALDLPLPPARMPLFRGKRPLKRWRYVGVFGPELMVCAAEAFAGPLGQRFWGVAEPDGSLWSGRALIGSGGVSLSDLRVAVRARAGGSGGRVEIDVELELGDRAPAPAPAPVESVSASDARGYVWTRKQAGVPARVTVSLDGRSRTLAGEAVIDDTAGYHERHTEWRWSAGVGRGTDGERIGWNLVEGVNDDPERSERTLWVDGEPVEAAPARFAPDLSSVRADDGGELAFRPWAVLAHRTRLGLVRSDYRQPFGEFSGALPGGVALAEGYGVMEHHDAWW